MTLKADMTIFTFLMQVSGFNVHGSMVHFPRTLEVCLNHLSKCNIVLNLCLFHNPSDSQWINSNPVIFLWLHLVSSENMLLLFVSHKYFLWLSIHHKAVELNLNTQSLLTFNIMSLIVASYL